MTAPIVVQQHIGAPPHVVYSYLTESEKWSRWQGGGVTLEARAGGIFRLVMPDGATARGQFVELVKDRRVVFTWGWVDHPGVPPGSSTVVIDITVEDGGSLVTLTHSGLPPGEVPLHRQGWTHYLPRLAARAEGRDVPSDTDPGQGD